VNCEEVRVQYSALLDDELGPFDTRSVEQHLAGCAACNAWADAADRLQRRIRVREAEPVPDLTSAILARSHPPKPGRGEWIRYSLAAVALTQLVLALPALVLADEVGASTHIARHIGAMSAALALGFVYTAWRPQRAYGVLPIATALAATVVVTGVLDTIRGVTPLLGESTHVLELVGFALVWLLAGAPGAPGRRRARRVSTPILGDLHAVEDVA
jgi:predicted anti-sigma-YlaC factor YlaD